MPLSSCHDDINHAFDFRSFRQMSHGCGDMLLCSYAPVMMTSIMPLTVTQLSCGCSVVACAPVMISIMPLTVTQTSHVCSEVPLCSHFDDINHAFITQMSHGCRNVILVALLLHISEFRVQSVFINYECEI